MTAGGADTLKGGLGNDTYVLGAENDAVIDTGGTDTITSTITRSLAGHATIERLSLVGLSNISGTGGWQFCIRHRHRPAPASLQQRSSGRMLLAGG